MFRGGVCFFPLRINPQGETYVGFVCLLMSYYRPFKKLYSLGYFFFSFEAIVIEYYCPGGH